MTDAAAESGNGKLLARIDERTEQMLKRLDALAECLETHAREIGQLKIDTARIGERQTIAHGLQSVWTLIVGTVAAYLGTRQ
jgi:hypothetical protein